MLEILLEGLIRMKNIGGMERIITARSKILEELKSRYQQGDKQVKRSAHEYSGQGYTECPICKGTLRYSRFDSRIHAVCETKLCVRWVE